MDMPMGTTAAMATMTGVAEAAATTGAAMSMGGMGGGSGCKISMLWNWYTIDSCFIASGWHIRTDAQFAGSCIGVILLVMALEGVRRAVKEFDRMLIRQHRASLRAKVDASAAQGYVHVSGAGRPGPAAQAAPASAPPSEGGLSDAAVQGHAGKAQAAADEDEDAIGPALSGGGRGAKGAGVAVAAEVAQPAAGESKKPTLGQKMHNLFGGDSHNVEAGPSNVIDLAQRGFYPTILQQAIRAFLHMCQFALAYMIMLLAMYYNGYIIFCIFIGAYLGGFIGQYERLGTGGPQTSASHEATVCCG